jgi:hypothetical protein
MRAAQLFGDDGVSASKIRDLLYFFPFQPEELCDSEFSCLRQQ